MLKDDVLKELDRKAVEIWDGRFFTRFKSGILELIIELENTNEPTGLWKEFDNLRFMGYEIHIVKVPIGYIEIIKEKKKVR